MDPKRETAYNEFMSLAERCREKASEAIDKGTPVRARGWIVAAQDATRAAEQSDVLEGLTSDDLAEILIALTLTQHHATDAATHDDLMRRIDREIQRRS